MKKTLTLTTAALGIASLALAGAAGATGTNVRVTVGGSTTGTYPLTATSTTSHAFTGPVNVTCTSAAIPASSAGVPGSAVNAGAAVLNIFTMNRLNYTSCSGPGGVFPVSASGSWVFHMTSGATTGSVDVIQGHLDNVTLAMGSPGGPCTLVVQGRANASYVESNRRLTINEIGNAALTVTSTNGCSGTVAPGNLVKYSGTFQVNAPTSAIRIG